WVSGFSEPLHGDPNYTRLARLCEWLADEAEAAQDDVACSCLIDPVLHQYVETAEQLCQAGESTPERLTLFLRHQPRLATRDTTTVSARTLRLRHSLPTFR
ncbi:hypothetical protein, partial [Salinicola salarius]|uniref:hypothetical protein n=1 Tax=Salinicola salarius TaxID=430457 RepID=UPI0015C58D54